MILIDFLHRIYIFKLYTIFDELSIVFSFCISTRKLNKRFKVMHIILRLTQFTYYRHFSKKYTTSLKKKNKDSFYSTLCILFFYQPELIYQPHIGIFLIGIYKIFQIAIFLAFQSAMQTLKISQPFLMFSLVFTKTVEQCR